MENSAVRYLYVVGQPGSGISTFFRELSEGRSFASISFMPEVDRLAPERLAQYLRTIRREPSPRLLAATACDPSWPQPFSEARPGELCIITDDDLALTPEEIVSLFSANGIDIGLQCAAKIFDINAGWIAGVSYALRLWMNEGRGVACDPASRAYHGLRAYVSQSVLSRLSPDELGVLVTAVATREVVDDVLHCALPAANIEVAVAALLRRRLLVRTPSGVRAPSIVSEAVREHYRGDFRTLGAQIAEDLASAGNFYQAARVSFASGSPEKGVEHLQAVPMEELMARRVDFRHVASSLSDAVLCAHPVLWFATLHWRRHRIDLRVLIAEGQMLLETFGSDPTVALLLKSALHIGYYEAGEFEHARALEDDLAAAGSNVKIPTFVRGSIAGNKAATLSLTGHVTEAARELQAASALLAQSPMLLSLFMQIHVRKASIQGHWFAEQTFHQRAIAAADESGDESAIALALLEAAFGALMAGDRDARERFMARMRSLSDSHEIAPFTAFSRIGSGARMDIGARFGLPRLRGIAHLFHAAAAECANDARAHLNAALDEFDNSGYLFGRVLARVALAQVVPQRQAEFVAQAKAIAHELNFPKLHGALSHLALGELPAHDQPLLRFVEQMRRFGESSPPQFTLSILRGTIEREGRTLEVSPKVFLLLAALGLRGRPLHREELCEMLWPDAAPHDAANALKMTVRRARVQCASPSVVRWSNAKYSLGEDVRVDVDEVRRLTEGALKDKQIFGGLRGQLLGIYKAVARRRPASLLEHEWFVGTDAALTHIQMQLGEALARDMIARGDFLAAIELSALMIECDPCDETAWELVIRTNLAAGQRDLAVRALREYRHLAAEQLQMAPSARIERLLANE